MVKKPGHSTFLKRAGLWLPRGADGNGEVERVLFEGGEGRGAEKPDRVRLMT